MFSLWLELKKYQAINAAIFFNVTIKKIGVIVYFHSVSSDSGEGAWLELCLSNYKNTIFFFNP